MRCIILFITGITLLTSCDCLQRVTGTIVDKETGAALQGVTVYNKNKDWNKITTDSSGHFELSSISGGFRCPPMEIVVENANYKKFEVKIPAGGEMIIQLEK